MAPQLTEQALQHKHVLCLVTRMALAGAVWVSQTIQAPAPALGAACAGCVAAGYAQAALRGEQVGACGVAPVAWWSKFRPLLCIVWVVAASMVASGVTFGGLVGFADPIIGIVLYEYTKPWNLRGGGADRHFQNALDEDFPVI